MLLFKTLFKVFDIGKVSLSGYLFKLMAADLPRPVILAVIIGGSANISHRQRRHAACRLEAGDTGQAGMPACRVVRLIIGRPHDTGLITPYPNSDPIFIGCQSREIAVAVRCNEV